MGGIGRAGKKRDGGNGGITVGMVELLHDGDFDLEILQRVVNLLARLQHAHLPQLLLVQHF